MNEFFLADDLSGALDAGAAFFRAGRRVRTVLDGRLPDEWGEDVLAVTTETRNASAEVAQANVREVLEQARARGARVLFKKIDSTMRGPVAAELGAVLAAMPEVRVLFSPANPAAGRTVSGGVLYVRGVPVGETEFARDPVWPVRASALRELLGAAASERVTIVDAESQEDLDRAVAALRADDRPWIGIGSGALALAVAGKRKRTQKDSMLPGGRTLVVCGSGHPLNRGQAERLRNKRDVSVREVKVASEPSSADAAGNVLMIEAARGESGAALRAIVAAAKAEIERRGVRRVFATGGETAFALCRELGICALEFVAEIEPGVCVCAAKLGDEKLWLAVKPGGFGDEETWVRMWDWLSGTATQGQA